MTTEQSPSPQPSPSAARPPGLRALVYAALPPDATPTGTLSQPLHRHVLDKAQGDVVELTRERMSAQFGDQPHVVLTLRDGDLDPATDQDLWGLMRQSEGGVLVFGVSYALDQAPADSDESCPECGARNAFVLSEQASPAHGRPATTLIECRDCGTVWDA